LAGVNKAGDLPADYQTAQTLTLSTTQGWCCSSTRMTHYFFPDIYVHIPKYDHKKKVKSFTF